jgi:hypothetical protein
MEILGLLEKLDASLMLLRSTDGGREFSHPLQGRQLAELREDLVPRAGEWREYKRRQGSPSLADKLVLAGLPEGGWYQSGECSYPQHYEYVTWGTWKLSYGQPNIPQFRNPYCGRTDLLPDR